RQVAPPRGFPIGTGQHSEHAGCRFGGSAVDRADARMGVRRSQHVAKDYARQDHVVDIAAAAAQQPRVLEARYRLTQRKFTHAYLRPMSPSSSVPVPDDGTKSAT